MEAEEVRALVKEVLKEHLDLEVESSYSYEGNTTYVKLQVRLLLDSEVLARAEDSFRVDDE